MAEGRASIPGAALGVWGRGRRPGLRRPRRPRPRPVSYDCRLTARIVRMAWQNPSVESKAETNALPRPASAA